MEERVVSEYADASRKMKDRVGEQFGAIIDAIRSSLGKAHLAKWGITFKTPKGETYPVASKGVEGCYIRSKELGLNIYLGTDWKSAGHNIVTGKGWEHALKDRTYIVIRGFDFEVMTRFPVKFKLNDDFASKKHYTVTAKVNRDKVVERVEDVVDMMVSNEKSKRLEQATRFLEKLATGEFDSASEPDSHKTLRKAVADATVLLKRWGVIEDK